jgi:hypothetical protein
MTGPGAGSSGGANKHADVGGADAVPDTPSTAKRQGAEPNVVERRKTPRSSTATATSSGSGMKPVLWIVVAVVVIAAIVFGMGLV